MALTSLGLASEGLLDRGSNPALHIAVYGYLREAGDAPVQAKRGGIDLGRQRQAQYEEIARHQAEWEREEKRRLKEIQALENAISVRKSKKKGVSRKEETKAIASALQTVLAEYQTDFLADTVAKMEKIAKNMEEGRVKQQEILALARFIDQIRQYEDRRRKNNDEALILILTS